MTIKIKAVESIIEWDSELGRMSILNPGDVAEVGKKLAEAKIDQGAAKLHDAAGTDGEPAAKPKRGRKPASDQADAAGADGEPAGAAEEAPPA